MLDTIAVSGYRSLRDVVIPLAPLTVVTGANGSGKSSLYRALRLLSACGRGDVVGALAAEGGLQSALWAGPESLAAARRGAQVQGTTRRGPISLRLGCASSEFGYLVDLGLPVPSQYVAGAGLRESAFQRDPEIKREAVFAGGFMRPATTQARRKRALAEVREGGRWLQLTDSLASYRSMLTEFADPVRAPELANVRAQLRRWRFYDGFRTDADAPARVPRVGTRTPVMADDGGDLPAAVQTILEAGHRDLLDVIADAFDGARPKVAQHDGYFELVLHQRGLLRPLRAAELSDGTLRFILWATALLALDLPSLMVLNEPETSLHPDLLRPLARLVRAASRRTQVVVVSHAGAFVDALGVTPLGDDAADDNAADDNVAVGDVGVGDVAVGDAGVEVRLVKDLGETRVDGLGMLTTPPWEWGSR